MQMAVLQSQNAVPYNSFNKPAHAGEIILQSAKNSGNFVVFEGIAGRNRFLSTQEQIIIHLFVNVTEGKSQHEKYLVANIFPILKRKLANRCLAEYRLVNGERNPWLRQATNFNLAPDLFVAPHYAVSYTPPYKNAPPNSKDCVVDYGVIPSMSLFESVASLLEAKVHIDHRRLLFIHYIKCWHQF